MTENPSLVIYRSSAGSGKTYTLVKEYLKILLNDPESYKNILAVTFTNKAAAEMKQRIINSLDMLSKGEDKQLEAQLREEGINGDIAYLCRIILVNILHNYTYFSVQTIDSFFYKVIRSFSREIGLYLGTKVQLDTKYVLGTIIDDLLRDAGVDDRLTAYFEDFIFSNMDDSKPWRIDYALKGLGNEIFKERYQEKLLNVDQKLVSNPEKLAGFKNELYKEMEDFENFLKDISIEVESYYNGHGFSYNDFWQKSKSFMHWLCEDLKNGNYKCTKAVVATYNDRNYIYQNLKDKEKIKILKEKIEPLFVQAVEKCMSKGKLFNTIKVLKTTLHTIGIFEEILIRLREYRDTQRELLISEFNPLLRSFVVNEASPFIYEKIGNTYKHFLIDEAQDTSTFQWDNLKPLAENAMSEGGKVVIVGDVKQSIFRWRNGNMDLLLHKIKHDLQRFTNEKTDRSLITNRRSKKEIIDFINSFMVVSLPLLREKLINRYQYLSSGTEYDLLQDIFIETQQNVLEKNTGGYVNLTFINSADIEDDRETSEKISERVTDIIDNVISLGYTYSDITILARRNIQCYNLAVHLLKNGKPVISSESLLIANSPKIRLIINLLQLILNNSDDFTKLEAIFNRLYYLYDGDVDLAVLFTGKQNDILNIIENTFPKQLFKNKAEFSINEILANMSLYEIVENIVRLFALSRADNGIDAFVTRFLDVVLDYTSQYSSDINSFLEWWSENSDDISISMPESIPAIRIMTIHKAKGLQNKIIIMANAGWKMDPDGAKNMIWASSDVPPLNDYSAYLVPAKKDLDQTYFKDDYFNEGILSNIDNLNLLYVALTRAEDHLYIIFPYKSKKEKEKKEKEKKEKEGQITTTSDLMIQILKNKGLIDNEPENEIEFGECKNFRSFDEIASELEKEPAMIAEDIKHSKIKKGFIGLNNIIIHPRQKVLKLIKDRQFRDKTNFGELVHETLYRIKDHDDIGKTLNELEKEGLVNDFNRQQLKEKIENVLSDEKVKAWFSDEWEVKAEAEILMPDGKIIRPDRVIIKDNKAVIIDWKTGIHKDEHFEQVRKYAEALKDNGYEIEAMFIYNFLDNKVIQVTDK